MKTSVFHSILALHNSNSDSDAPSKSKGARTLVRSRRFSLFAGPLSAKTCHCAMGSSSIRHARNSALP